MLKQGREGVFGELGRAFKDGSNATKLSALIMGFGQIRRGQIAKGCLYLFLQTAFLAFMVFFGGSYISRLFSGDLGTQLAGERWNEELQIFEKIKGDNSFLILLYGVATLVILLCFLVVWAMNVKGSYQNDLRLRAGGRLNTFKEDVVSLLNERFHVPLLLFPSLGLLVFTVMPLLFMILIAFTNYDYAHMRLGSCSIG